MIKPLKFNNEVANMWSRLKENLPKVEEKKANASHDFAARTAQHFNFFGTVNNILDQSLNLTIHESTAVSEFWSHSVPYYVTALYYLVPALIPFVYVLKDYYSHQDNEDEHNAEMKEKDLLRSRRPSVRDFFKKHPEVKKNLSSKMDELEFKNIKIDIVINSIYFAVRGCHSAIILLHVNNLTSDETSDNINDWMNTVSSIVSLLYVSAMLIHKHYHVQALEETKKGFQKYNRYFFKAAHGFKSLAKKPEESKSDSLAAPLLSPGPGMV